MSCACENRKKAAEYDRIRALAKAYATMEGVTVAIYRNGDGTFNFTTVTDSRGKQIVEYISSN